MSSFTTPLVVSPMSDGKHWELINRFVYHIGDKRSRRYIKVPKGFVTDFASVPRLFFFLPDWATYSKAPVLHDYLYHAKQTTRGNADRIFLESMLVDFRNHKSGKIIARVEYTAVVLFGWLAWHRKGNKENVIDGE